MQAVGNGRLKKKSVNWRVHKKGREDRKPDKQHRQPFERTVLDYIFPRRCVVCDEPSDQREKGVCRKCQEKIVYIRAPFCMKCGKAVRDAEDAYCEDCRKKTHVFLQGTAVFDYGSMADSIFRFKYGGRQEYAHFYGREMYERKKEWLAAIKPDALIPVPIHSSRKRKRGYNQAEVLARALSEHCGIPVYADLIGRTQKTLPQKNLTRRERQNILKKAFKILRNDVKLSTIVIIDDIYTTGSTIDAVATTLQEAGITKIYHMTLAAGRGI